MFFSLVPKITLFLWWLYSSIELWSSTLAPFFSLVYCQCSFYVKKKCCIKNTTFCIFKKASYSNVDQELNWSKGNMIYPKHFPLIIVQLIWYEGYAWEIWERECTLLAACDAPRHSVVLGKNLGDPCLNPDSAMEACWVTLSKSYTLSLAYLTSHFGSPSGRQAEHQCK